jgi:hypothetical protein
MWQYKNGFIRRVNQEFLCNSISGKRKLNYSKDKFVQGNFQFNEMKCKILYLHCFILPFALIFYQTTLGNSFKSKRIICDDLVGTPSGSSHIWNSIKLKDSITEKIFWRLDKLNIKHLWLFYFIFSLFLMAMNVNLSDTIYFLQSLVTSLEYHTVNEEI